VPAWHGPNKRFADAAQAGLGLQCAKSRLSASLIAAAISPGQSFPEPCSPRPPRQTFFFAAKLVFAVHMFPPLSAQPGLAKQRRGKLGNLQMPLALLCSSQPASHHSRLWLPVCREPDPTAEVGTGDSIITWPHIHPPAPPPSCVRKLSRLELLRF